MVSDADPLVSAVSRCILDFSEQRGRGKGEVRDDTATPYTALPSGLAPVRVSVFKSRLRHHHTSVPHSSEGGSSPCSDRSLADLFDVYPPENRTFQMMCDINWQEVSVRC